MAQLSDDCFAFGGSLLGIDAAREMIFERVRPVDGIDHVPLGGALGRTLAEDIAAPIAVPGFDNSAQPRYRAGADPARCSMAWANSRPARYDETCVRDKASDSSESGRPRWTNCLITLASG